MKNLLKKWIFIAQFHFQDPDPYSPGNFNPDPLGSGSETLQKDNKKSVTVPLSPLASYCNIPPLQPISE